MVSKVILWDKLTDLVIETLGLSIKRNGNIYQNGVLLDWDNFAYIDLEPIQYDEDIIDAVFIFGDATIEFHLKNDCETLNWSEFDSNIIIQVIKQLTEKLAELKK
ncbi:MAG: hypothetical protein PUJ92_05070 [Bacilli bacterium]|nr:hypothetical protein [Bacilli bacterium]MDY5833057.1 hypothetical protein [Candidatus Onthovivens sp.]